jgi:carbon monoxide dehydrogenase subunit G
MIETEQTVTILANIDEVWDFARDIRGWAGLMPGMQDCEVIDEDHSRWTLKVGVGGLVRTVRVGVHVARWDGPGLVDFAYKLEGDPVQGEGAYHAVALGSNETEVRLNVQVRGSGPMAPMWEAMGRPLLPQLAKGFAGQLKHAIEQRAGSSTGADAAPGISPPQGRIASLVNWTRTVWLALFGRAQRAGMTDNAPAMEDTR